MRTSDLSRHVLASLLVVAALAACGPEPEEGEDADDVGSVAVTDEDDDGAKEDSTRTFALGASKSVKFSFTEAAGAVIVTVDCRPPADPDTVGPQFAIKAADLGLARTTTEPTRAGYWQWAGPLSGGTHEVTVANRGAATSCTATVKRNKASGSCKAWKIFRSPNVNHTHLRVGTDTSSDWESFPTSGNHWGAWAPWNVVYSRPVKRSFFLHNLEHGGAVYSFKCGTGTGSCEPLATEMANLANALGASRVLVTPDPTQPSRFAIRTWRWAYRSECVDRASAGKFLSDHIRRGREDVDADPPVPFDPTTTTVPCENLMSAPDSCR